MVQTTILCVKQKRRRAFAQKGGELFFSEGANGVFAANPAFVLFFPGGFFLHMSFFLRYFAA
jgi:hypothetical protein